MMNGRRVGIVEVLVIALTGVLMTTLGAQQAPPPLATGAEPPAQMRERANAFFEALASGDAGRFEKMAQENFTPEALAQRSPENRKQLVQRVASDFGKLTLASVAVDDQNPVKMAVTGATGMEGTIELTLEPAPPYRIVKVGMRVEAGGGRRGDPRPDPEPAGPPPPVNGAMTTAQLSQALDGHLAKLADAGAFSGAVLVAKNGTTVYEKPFGLAERDKKVAVTPATRFNLGSINKSFTKVAIAQLMAQGKVALTDTIGKLLPDYPNEKARAATIDQLLHHRAGIADFFGPDFAKAPKSGFRSNNDYFRFVAAKPLLFEPGARMQYCNGCYIVLGAIIERVSGMPYEDYIARRVFEPAGMKSAAFLQTDRSPADMAVGYTRRGPDGPVDLHSNEQMHGAAGSAAGGAYATVADLLAFDNALREKRLIDDKMTAWVLDVDGVGGGRAMGSLGIAGGAPGCNAVLESDGTWTVVVLENADPPAAEQLGAAIYRQLAGGNKG
ncbi:MAG TPA: serine hydrolase domain-containing protein [Vicinamibacterales bacterium]|jgi:CubicO group peptidase (beta-lactamase class C family)